jgi:membrane-anchored protein YejM (alkaline phosphatase superfamily)
VRAESIWTTIGGVIVGLVLWLVAYSIAGDAVTMSRWDPVVLAVAAAFAVWAVLRARRLRRRGNYPLAAFVFALPVLPVLLSLGVLVDSYL